MNFLVYTRTNWNEPPRARHQLAEALSEFGKVYFIEANNFGFFKISIDKAKDSLLVIKSYFPMPSFIRFRFPIINELYQVWLFNILKKKTAVFSDSDVLISFDQTGSIFIRKWPKKSVYFCNDDHMRSYGIPFLKYYFSLTERRISLKTNWIFVTSDFLYNRLRRFSNSVRVIRLGAPHIPDSYEEKYFKLQKLKIAYVGFGGKKNDFGVVEEILMSKFDLEIHFFGSLNKALLKKMEKHKNFIYHGIKTNKDLYSQLYNCNVGIAPYALKFVNSGGTPNKLWLYLAVGLPVVTTELPNIVNWEFPNSFVYKSKDNTDFLKLILKAYNENTPYLCRNRVDFAKNNTWINRAEELLKIIETNEPTHPTT